MSEAAPAIVPLGEHGWTIVLGERVDRAIHQEVTALAARIEAAAIPGIVEIVPAYAALTVFFEGDAAAMRGRLLALSKNPAPAPGPDAGPSPSRLHIIPVRYDGPDLDWVATETGLSTAEIVRLHQAPEYLVYLLGFVPGFAYLGDLEPTLVLPRRATPRTRVPAGAVAIAGSQTAVYPLATPGGWHLIGSTAVELFDPRREPAALLRAGDRVRFEEAP
jgi:KipI family sensor histidine kinase inhibitor